MSLVYDNPATRLAPLRSTRKRWLIFATVSVALAIAAILAADRYSRASALADLEADARSEADLKVALLRAVLERPRALPLLLSRDPDVAAGLRGGPSAIALDRKLEGLVDATGASVLYVIGADGRTVSASNWREPTSFVGSDYSFRDYFREAMRAGEAEQFALGNVSKRPGLYISRRVETEDAPRGVVVVKMEFTGLEASWAGSGRPTFVANEDGVILITSRPDLRFLTTAPIPETRLAPIRESLQFGDAPLAPIPLVEGDRLGPGAGLVVAELAKGHRAAYLRLIVPVPTTHWQLSYFTPVDAVLSAAEREMRLMTVGTLLPLLFLAGLILRRREVAEVRREREQMARDNLERRVMERTRDLTQARDRLQAEIADHRATEARLQGVQQSLVQANRLAILGQVAAGVAHEINQPLATIRAYAENARIYLARAREKDVEDNLGAIAALTERIGTITEDLKALARKGRGDAEPVSLKAVIDGGIVLLRSRFAGRLEALEIHHPPDALMVMGNRVRLEQIVINLLQNALEALGERLDGKVRVSVRDEGDMAALLIADNGAGIAPDILDALFTPFNTSKEKGLGLGLVITKDIAADYGGTIEVDSSAAGTCFTVRLRKAGAHP
ncbi:two-component sensor histidine kinase [Xaviernesmea oryzae]|uniref:C4-dicarboxylate transport sensor protein n=1 Tax=Xaviernesmea oryzae TaxID=464029 RepID=A0A1Q9ATH5_9HYPH|nr:ATP-binding protein [Xaviernesmea oryzae]OLP58641.1 two-component sensor histidine kinase [Xaviernesmea oryzae]SEK65355.1 two-component system, NtrC family, C4-dicarboxylate transport sensor histidine kinase DctB [Xaviernesmea oryzae]